MKTLRKVKSSYLSHVLYDDQRQTLEVHLKDGSGYKYFSVSQKTFKKFMEADSQGSFHSTDIVGKYDHTRIAAPK